MSSQSARMPRPRRAPSRAAGIMGVVATTHPIGAQVGMAMLERGGNAFDAAVAIGLAQHVVASLQAGLGDAVTL